MQKQPTFINNLEKLSKKLSSKPVQILNSYPVLKTSEEARKQELIERDARKILQLAQTIGSIVEAIKLGKAKFLTGVRKKAHIETLEELLTSKKHTRLAKQNVPRVAIEFADPESVDIATVEYPYPRLGMFHLEHLENIKGAKELELLIKNFCKLRTLEAKWLGYILLKDPTYIDQFQRMINYLKQLNTHNWLVEILAMQLIHYNNLQEIGIKDLANLKLALGEYLALRIKYMLSDPVKKKQTQALNYAKDNYYPTDKSVVEQIVQLADIKPGIKVLQCLTGIIDIADSIREKYSDANLVVMENSFEVADIIKTKGHSLLQTDFYQHQENYHRIITSSPFKAFIGMAQIEHAYDLLNPDGKVIAIISEEAFLAKDKRAVLFRKWLKKLKGKTKKLPIGSFVYRKPNAGIFPTRLVIINKSTFF